MDTDQTAPEKQIQILNYGKQSNCPNIMGKYNVDRKLIISQGTSLNNLPPYYMQHFLKLGRQGWVSFVMLFKTLFMLVGTFDIFR